MKQDNRELASKWIAQFDERLSWLEQTIEDMEAEDRIAICAALGERRKRLADVLNLADDMNARVIHDKGLKQVTIEGMDGTLVVEVTNRATHSDVRRDELVSAVERAANDPSNRLDSTTGEMMDPLEVRVRLFKTCFRLEPRWTDLKKLGITADEYAQTTWKRSVKVSKAVGL